MSMSEWGIAVAAGVVVPILESNGLDPSMDLLQASSEHMFAEKLLVIEVWESGCVRVRARD
jgi:hypothetical protein